MSAIFFLCRWLTVKNVVFLAALFVSAHNNCFFYLFLEIIDNLKNDNYCIFYIIVKCPSYTDSGTFNISTCATRLTLVNSGTSK